MHRRKGRKSVTGWALMLVGGLMANTAHSSNFEKCVQSDGDLASVLDLARSEPVTAKIVQHNLTNQNAAYDLKNTVWHTVFGAGTQPGTELLGGYTAACATRDIAAGNTLIIDSAAGAFDFVEPRGDLTIEGLTFAVPDGISLGLGSDVYHNVKSGATVLFQRDAFMNGNNANSLFIDWEQAADSDSTIRIVDTLIANNSGLAGLCALQLNVGSGPPNST